jgi:hypothetical protein
MKMSKMNLVLAGSFLSFLAISGCSENGVSGVDDPGNSSSV